MSQGSSSAVVDLTSTSRQTRYAGLDFREMSPYHTPPIDTTAEVRGIKRRRIDGDNTPSSRYSPSSAAASSSNNSRQRNRHGQEDYIESVDLTEVNDDTALAKTLAKQREDAIKAQAATENKDGRTTLLAFKCAICMDTPTDSATTVCGHMFCHKCIIDSLRYEEDRSEATNGKSSKGKCPACRKHLSRKDTPGGRRDLVPLQFKLKTSS